MHRIDTSTAQADKFGEGKNGFTAGNPQTGEQPTALDADYFDSIQEEICGVIEAAGITLDKSKRNQLLSALPKLLLSRTHPFADIKADGAAAVAEGLANLGLGGYSLPVSLVSNFSVQGSAQVIAASSSTVMVSSAKNFDDLSEYSTQSGKFTAANAGTYIFTGGVHGASTSLSQRILMLYVNGAERCRLQENYQTICNAFLGGTSVPVKLNAGDYAQLVYFTSIADTASSFIFGGWRIK